MERDIRTPTRRTMRRLDLRFCYSLSPALYDAADEAADQMRHTIRKVCDLTASLMFLLAGCPAAPATSPRPSRVSAIPLLDHTLVFFWSARNVSVMTFKPEIRHLIRILLLRSCAPGTYSSVAICEQPSRLALS